MPEGKSCLSEKILDAVSDNAVKFTESGGSVHVWCKEKSADDEKVVYEFELGQWNRHEPGVYSSCL